MKNIIAFIVFSVVFANHALATPAQVLIIRHGEKVNDDIPTLSEKGYQRARALVKYFVNDRRVNSFGPPVAIFAAAPKKEGKSIRPYETVAPLAKYLKKKVILNYTSDHNEELAHYVLTSPAFHGKTVLISWTSSEIKKLAKKFNARNIPFTWPSSSFDRVWKIPFSSNGVAGAVENIPQQVLPGDSN